MQLADLENPDTVCREVCRLYDTYPDWMNLNDPYLAQLARRVKAFAWVGVVQPLSESQLRIARGSLSKWLRLED